jgi:hypothetical protein
MHHYAPALIGVGCSPSLPFAFSRSVHHVSRQHPCRRLDFDPTALALGLLGGECWKSATHARGAMIDDGAVDLGLACDVAEHVVWRICVIFCFVFLMREGKDI